MSRLETLSVLNTSDISTLEFVEQLIMYAYFFSGGLLKKILDYYPGLMLLAPCVYLPIFLWVSSWNGFYSCRSNGGVYSFFTLRRICSASKILGSELKCVL